MCARTGAFRPPSPVYRGRRGCTSYPLSADHLRWPAGAGAGASAGDGARRNGSGDSDGAGDDVRLRFFAAIFFRICRWITMATAPRIMLLGRRDREVGEVSSRRFTWIVTSSPQLHSVAASNSRMGVAASRHGLAASRAAASHLVWTVVQVWLLLVRLVEVEVDQGEHHLDRWTEHADTALATLHLPPLLYLLYLPMHLLVYVNV